jgi:hypothetical protein
MIVDGDAGEVTSMNEDELAELFERRRGDTSHWSEKPVKAKVGRRGSVVFSVRFSPEELVLLRDRAQERGRTISDLIRSAALQAVGRTSDVDTSTIDKQFPALSAACGPAVALTSDYAGASQPLRQPDQPAVEYVFGTEGSPRSASAAQLVPA